MSSFELISEHSSYYIFLCLLIGTGYAAFFYFQNNKFSKLLTWILSTLRFVLVSIICYLLLVPLIKSVNSLIEKPIVALIIDDSESMLLSEDNKKEGFISSLSNVSSTLESKGIQVDIITSNNVQQLDSINFDAKFTNISKLIAKAKSTYEGRNLVGAVLVSDGIHNRGINRMYSETNFPIHILAVGDTLKQEDVWIEKISVNKTAYLKNKFPVEVNIGNHGFVGRKSKIKLWYDKKVIADENVAFNQNKSIQKFNFLIDADSIGKHQIRVEVLSMSDEKNTINNSMTKYIDVVNSKQSILLCAYSPHPDVKMLKRIIDSKEIFEIEMVLLSANQEPKKTKYDLVIFHHLPPQSLVKYPFLSKYQKQNLLYMMGTKSNFSEVSKLIGSKIKLSNNQSDLAQGKFNVDNDVLQLTGDQINSIEKLPPLTIPFFDLTSKSGYNLILKQQIGSVETEKPILLVKKILNQKIGIFFGEGFWKWRMIDKSTQEMDENLSVDILFQKVIQHLSSRLDKRKLVIEPSKEIFSVSTDVLLNVHVFNDLYEDIFDKKVQIKIGNDNFEFIPTKGGSTMNVGQFAEGVYSYTGSVVLDGQTISYRGQFTVEHQNLEAYSTTADFNLLSTISNNNLGEFQLLQNNSELVKSLVSKGYKSKVISNFEDYTELLDKKWLLLLLILIVSSEWILRKYNGFI